MIDKTQPSISELSGLPDEAIKVLALVLPFVDAVPMNKGELQKFVGRSSATIDELISRPGFPKDVKGSELTFWKPAVAWYIFMYNIKNGDVK